MFLKHSVIFISVLKVKTLSQGFIVSNEFCLPYNLDAGVK